MLLPQPEGIVKPSFSPSSRPWLNPLKGRSKSLATVLCGSEPVTLRSRIPDKSKSDHSSTKPKLILFHVFPTSCCLRKITSSDIQVDLNKCSFSNQVMCHKEIIIGWCCCFRRGSLCLGRWIFWSMYNATHCKGGPWKSYLRRNTFRRDRCPLELLWNSAQSHQKYSWCQESREKKNKWWVF